MVYVHLWLDINSQQREPNYNEKLERRLTDAVLRMFNDSKSFYYSFTGDLTRSLLQLQSNDTEDEDKTSLPLWKKVYYLLDQTVNHIVDST